MQTIQQRRRSQRASSFGLSRDVLVNIATSLGSKGFSAGSKPTESRLLGLPTELLQLVADFLDLPSVTSLRWTCRQLYYRIPGKRQVKMDELVSMESWPEYTTHLGYLAGMMPQIVSSLSFSQERNLFACSGCLKLKPPEQFSTSMLDRGYSKSFSGDDAARDSIYRNILRPYVANGEEATDERFQRLCIDCGIATGKYWPGTTLNYGSPLARRGSKERGVGIVCGRCGHFETIQFEDSGNGPRRKCLCGRRQSSVLPRHGLQSTKIYEEAVVDDEDD